MVMYAIACYRISKKHEIIICLKRCFTLYVKSFRLWKLMTMANG